jgi:hypothetical protein
MRENILKFSEQKSLKKGFANANKKHTGIEKEIELNCQIFHTLEERFYTK